MKACPNCGEEWPSTASVCICGTSLDSAERVNAGVRSSRPDGVGAGSPSGLSTLQVVVSVIVVLALVPSVVILARALSFSGGTPSTVDVPDNAPEAQPDQLPDRRERPIIACTGSDVADDCVAWVFTLPGNAFTNYHLDVTETGVAVRTREDIWLLDPTTGEQRWHRQEPAGPTAAVSVWLADDMVVLDIPDGFRTFDGSTGDPAAVVTMDDEIVWMGSDGKRVVTVTRADEVTLQGWDPTSGDLLWAAQVEIPTGHDVLPIDDWVMGQLTVMTARNPGQDSVPDRTTIDMSTGRVIDDPDVDPYIRDAPAFRVLRSGTRLSGGGFNGIPEWQRDLDGPYGDDGFSPVPITLDHVALFGRDHDFLVIDARTGDDVAHVRVTDGRLHQGGPVRPWPDAQRLMLQVQTSDSRHIVLLDLPLGPSSTPAARR